jgi:type VI secretion system protein
LRLSIVDHLTRLLNSRRGALAHLPEHGLPDIAQVYQGLPYSVDELVESIRRTIARFEPRLNRVDVRYEPVDKGNCVLQLEIDAYLGDGERVYFDTYFMSGGYAEVRPTRRRH